MNTLKAGNPPLGMKIRDLPEHQKPREKLMELGAQSLSDAEILALFIRTGTTRSSAVELCHSLIQRHGSIGAIGAMSANDLSQEYGLGPAKASCLVAAFELGSRVARERVHAQKMDSPEAIYSYFAPQLSHLPHEHVLVAAVDCRLCHLATHTVSIGSINESIAHPRDILRPVISRGAHGFVLIHNHPSGDPTPSSADVEVTKRIRDAAEIMQLRFVDHLIIGREGQTRSPWFSFRESGRINE